MSFLDEIKIREAKRYLLENILMNNRKNSVIASFQGDTVVWKVKPYNVEQKLLIQDEIITESKKVLDQRLEEIKKLSEIISKNGIKL